jgi:preprotein translocase subunit SecE
VKSRLQKQDVREVLQSVGIWCGMAKTNPFEFIQQVRTETAKVTWPTRKETIVTTIMVLIMVVLASIFFFIADQILAWGVSLVLGLGR